MTGAAVPAPLPEDRPSREIAFLDRTGWSDAARVPLAGDASTRRYFRLDGGPRKALFLDAPPGAETAPCPPDADADMRRALGYNALARLAGPRLDAFTAIAGYLRGAGVRAPAIFAEDPAAGFAVIEDFGDRLLVRAVAEGMDEARLYASALETIRPLRATAEAPRYLNEWPLQTYDEVAFRAEADLLPEWYAPFANLTLPGEAAEDWAERWTQTLAALSPPRTLVLRDYHAENILVPDDGPLAVIDFQDALIGQAAYDVVSLLEDARRDVDQGLAHELLAEETAQAEDPAAFASDYAILATQRNTKILGVFARLVVRDHKPRYEGFMPRVRAHLARDLDREAAAPLRPWFERHLPQLLSDHEGAR